MFETVNNETIHGNFIAKKKAKNNFVMKNFRKKQLLRSKFHSQRGQYLQQESISGWNGHSKGNYFDLEGSDL